MKTLNVVSLAIVIVLLLISGPKVLAQSTLFNIPSTDVVSEKKVYLEFDFVSHFEKHADGGFQSYVPRGIVGLGHRVEAGVNLVYTKGFGMSQPMEIQPNMKWKFYQNEKTGISAAAGGILYAPITHRAGTDTFALVYSTFSKKVQGNYGPRLTGGGYSLVGRADGTGSKSGAIVGYEQPLTGKVSFVADWFSGKNRFGYVTPGVSVVVTTRSAVYAGYSIGNVGRKNNALFVYYGITF